MVVSPAPDWVSSQWLLAPSVTKTRLWANDEYDKGLKPGTVHRSPQIEFFTPNEVGRIEKDVMDGGKRKEVKKEYF